MLLSYSVLVVTAHLHHRCLSRRSLMAPALESPLDLYHILNSQQKDANSRTRGTGKRTGRLPLHVVARDEGEHELAGLVG